MKIEDLISQLEPPILVLGASGFIGSNLFRAIYSQRKDVYGTAQTLPAWRLSGIPGAQVLILDLLNPTSLDWIFREIQPKTVFNLVAFGAYSFETSPEQIHLTNYNFVQRLLEVSLKNRVNRLVHAGSSSEYGLNSNRPTEDTLPLPNSHYAVSKFAASQLIYHYGKQKCLPCANLRLYSVYGPFEDSSRLVPNLVKEAMKGCFPPLVNSSTCRDFLYVDDAVKAFLSTAVMLPKSYYGESFNIGTGKGTTIGELASVAARVFRLSGRPTIT
ncbi:NAD-dependent epimerase/dehydratase family protein [Bdellovibrionota bacterium FG-2]